MFEELQGRLEEAEWLSEDDRAMLAELLGGMREACASMEANPAIGPKQAAERREELRASWLNALDACHKVEVAEGEALMAGAVLAEKMRDMTLLMLRAAHGMRKGLEEGDFTGTWEQREVLLETLNQVEAGRASLLERLTAEDIRQLEAEGVL
jgi:hypothetical protein